jgi:flagellar hook-associated protein 2
MDEKNIERWEEKAKSGTLRGDSILSGALNQMREDLYTAVSGITGITQLTQIGITTSDNYRDGGKLEIDPDKLKVALTENPNAVFEIFSKKGTKSSENGLGVRLRETIETTMKNIEKRAGKEISVNHSFTLGRTLNNIENQIYRFEDRLMKVEDRYWRQFTAMEKAIQRANSQSMYLMQQFGGGM